MAVLHSFLLMVGLHLFLRKDELHLIAHEGDLLEVYTSAEQRGTVGVEEVGEEGKVLPCGGLQVVGVGLLDVARSPLGVASVEVILRLWTVGDELAVYSGNDDQIVPILSLGGFGVISVLSNVAPKTTHDICQHYFDGNVAEAMRLQIAYTDLIDALFCEVNPIPVKTAMRRLGYETGPLRMPLTEMEPANAAKLDAALRAHNLVK